MNVQLLRDSLYNCLNAALLTSIWHAEPLLRLMAVQRLMSCPSHHSHQQALQAPARRAGLSPPHNSQQADPAEDLPDLVEDLPDLAPLILLPTGHPFW